MEDQVRKLDEMQRSVSDICIQFKHITIANEAQDIEVAESALKIRAVKKAIEDRHALLVGPYKEITKALDAKKRALVEPIDELLEIVRKERGRFAMVKAEQAREEARKLEVQRQEALHKKNREEEAAKALGFTDHAPVLEYAEKDEELRRQQDYAAKAGKTKGLRMVWKFEIETAAEVPRQYLVPDESAIRKAVAAGQRVIPGVRVWEEPYVQIR